MIARAERRIWQIAEGGKDPGNNRPDPEQLHGDEQADISDELASFKVPDGLQVNLFASDAEGLSSAPGDPLGPFRTDVCNGNDNLSTRLSR